MFCIVSSWNRFIYPIVIWICTSAYFCDFFILLNVQSFVIQCCEKLFWRKLIYVLSFFAIISKAFLCNPFTITVTYFPLDRFKVPSGNKILNVDSWSDYLEESVSWSKNAWREEICRHKNWMKSGLNSSSGSHQRSSHAAFSTPRCRLLSLSYLIKSNL